jgi:hypothetical protein
VTAAAPPGAGLAPLGRCRVCYAEVSADAARCPNCSAALGAQDPCPSCRAQAGSSPDKEFRYVCDVCGAPRVPRFDKSIAYSGREAPLLRRADAARKARAGWRGAAIATGIVLPITAFFFLALLALVGMKVWAILTALLVLAPLAIFLAFAIGRASARGREIGPAIDSAWLAVATDIAQHQGAALTATSLARALGVEEPQAEELLALVDVERIAGPSVPRHVRIAAPEIAAGPTQIAAAEEEAALAEQIAADEKARREAGK